MNVFTDLSVPEVSVTSTVSLTDVNVKNISTYGPVGGFFMAGGAWDKTTSWSLPGLSAPAVMVAGLPNGSYHISHPYGTDFSLLLTPSPFGPYNDLKQIGAIIDENTISSSTVRVNCIKLDDNGSGTSNQRSCGLSGTFFSKIPDSTITNLFDKNTRTTLNTGMSITDSVITNLYTKERVDMYGTTRINSGVIATGLIVNNSMLLYYRNPHVSVSYANYGNGNHNVILGGNAIKAGNFSVQASHVYGAGGEDTVIACNISNTTVGLYSYHSRSNNSLRSKNIYFAIYGVLLL